MIFDISAIGKHISNLRKKNDMTQMELADKLLVSYQAVSNWERGSTMPDIAKLPELAMIFGVTVDEILGSSKGADVIKSIQEGTRLDSVTPDEVVEIAPILKAEQVDALAQSANSAFSQTQAEQLFPLLSFEGDYEYSNEELAERLYQKKGIAFYAIIISKLSPEKQKEIALRAFADDSPPFFSVSLPYLPEEMKVALALRAYDEDKIALFSILMDFLSPAQRNQLRNKAVNDEKVSFFSVLQDR